MIRKIFNVGMPRSGTKSMAVLMKRLGVRSSHQRSSFIGHERAIIPYDLDHFPKRVINFLNSHRLDWMYDDDPWFESSWGNALVIYPLSLKFPQLRFFITVRDIKSQANSLRYGRVEHSMNRNPKKWELVKHQVQQDINYYAERWIVMHSFLIEQVKKMKNKPILIHFEKYIEGHYNDLFLKIWKPKDNYYTTSKMINDFLKIKVNTWGDWKYLTVPQKYINKSQELIIELETLCKHNWWICEGLTIQ